MCNPAEDKVAEGNNIVWIVWIFSAILYNFHEIQY